MVREEDDGHRTLGAPSTGDLYRLLEEAFDRIEELEARLDAIHGASGRRRSADVSLAEPTIERTRRRSR